ncbi:8403_t:CDS:2 [Rhizophagus irregularis]|nr:8403_t:CDS:2 [Rhizophagus irregularis]
MLSYNPLEEPDTIAEIVQKLPLEVLDKFCWINSTWYKEIQHELRRRWKIQVLEYQKLDNEQELEMEEVERKYPNDEFMQGYLHCEIWGTYIKRELEEAKKQVEIESYLLRNGMLYEQEKEMRRERATLFFATEIIESNWIGNYVEEQTGLEPDKELTDSSDSDYAPPE